jgi:hypothetical protein
MAQAASSLVADGHHVLMHSAEQASSFSASEIREAIAYWVSQDRLDHAEALVAAGLGLYPESQDILAIGALLAEIQQDWAQAQHCIERLMLVQGEDSPPDTWRHLVRVMRCRQAYHQAFMHAQKALQRFPDHTELREEHAQLAALMEPAAVQTKVEALVV